jgi:hypothetical protein
LPGTTKSEKPAKINTTTLLHHIVLEYKSYDHHNIATFFTSG